MGAQSQTGDDDATISFGNSTRYPPRFEGNLNDDHTDNGRNLLK
jgi:hypothetical protein